MRFLAFLAIGVLLVTRPSTHSAQAPKATVIPVHNGRNRIDLLGNGAPGEVIIAARGNGNAHGFHAAMFQLFASEYPWDSTSDRVWQLLPFLGGSNDPVSGSELYRTSEGADCMLSDLRIVRRAARAPVEVIIAHRDLGESFADSAAVRFEFYEVQVDREGVAGSPPYFFQRTRTVKARRHYCDVDDAFDKELHLGKAGIVSWSGPR